MIGVAVRLLSVLVACLVLVGCTPGGVESPTPTESPVVTESPTVSASPTVESPTPSPSPTPAAFQSYPADLPTEDPETAAIIEGWQEYQRVYEKFAMDPLGYTDFTETQYVTTGHESTGILERLEALREENLALVGGLKYSDIEVGEFTNNSEGLRSAVLTYCLDINELQVRDLATGDLVERSGRYTEQAFMTEGLDGIWRVEGLNTLDETC